MPLYKQRGITHYTFDVIVLTSSEKSFSRLHRKIFQEELNHICCQTTYAKQSLGLREVDHTS